MDLYILRHGIAVKRGTPGYRDEDRPLVARGLQETQKGARALKKTGLDFDLIFASPFLRTKQTAQIVAKVLHCSKKLQWTRDLTPKASPKKFAKKFLKPLRAYKKVLIVGHEPFLSQLISFLLTGKKSLPLELDKGGFAKLVLEKKKARLEWILTSRHLASLK